MLGYQADALTKFGRNRENPRAPSLTESNYEGPPRRALALLDREFHFRPWRVAIKRTFDGLWNGGKWKRCVQGVLGI